MYLVNRQFKKCYDFYSMFATFFLILKAKTRFNVFIFTQSFITFTTLKATTANKLLSQCQQFVQIRVVIWWICMDYWSRTMFGVSEWDRKPSGKKEWRRTGERQTDREREREREIWEELSDCNGRGKMKCDLQDDNNANEQLQCRRLRPNLIKSTPRRRR